MSSTSFKQRVLNTITDCAPRFKAVFMDYEYLIYSEKFTMQPYYIISTIAGNYKHLTGVNSTVSPHDFFEMCLNRTLTADDFDFSKEGQDEKFVRGVVRSKIIALPSMFDLFTNDLNAKENFTQGTVNCSLATTDNAITIGFEQRINASPKTLLKGNELREENIVNVTLVLRRAKGADKFDTVLQGDTLSFRELHKGVHIVNSK